METKEGKPDLRPSDIKKAVLVYNRNSGKQFFAGNSRRVREILELLESLLGRGSVRLREVRRFEEIAAAAGEIAAQREEWVIIAGGDGTIRALIERLASLFYFPYISIFPAGTINLIARELHLSRNPEKWFSRVAKLHTVPVYYGMANFHLFLTVAGIGFDSLVVRSVSEKEKKLLNTLAYVLEGTDIVRREVLFGNWPYRFSVRFDDETEWQEGTSVIVGKSRYYAGRYNLFKKASLALPVFYVALFKGAGRADFLRYAARMALGALEGVDDILVRTASKLEIRCNEEGFAAELDGDAVTAAPLLISMGDTPLKFIA